MYVSLFELFKIGIGPSSSHTMGPMVAAKRFIDSLKTKQLDDKINKITINLYGSLAFTGKGHKTYEAIALGLCGFVPSNIDALEKEQLLSTIISNKKITISKNEFDFDINKNIKPIQKNIYNKHPNPMLFKCFLSNNTIYEEVFYSIGGGFIIKDGDSNKVESINYKHNFNSFKQLEELCTTYGKSIFEIVCDNEQIHYKNEDELRCAILSIWINMNEIINNGIKSTGKIDHYLNVEKRANYLNNKIKSKEQYDPLELLDRVSIYAIATCEENASGNKIVTAPTNGAAGIIPAIIKYYTKFINNSNEDGIICFLATASAIGMLFKNNASISGAEMGCQGEVGVACSMAAGGLTAALGGTVNQIENAAEIAMEHNLGLTCDPIKGLVQIPCIERNSMGAIKAINASRLALNSDKPHKVSLDQVIKTMYETGKSMNSKYKETSLGGLAVNVVEC